ncbi:hypothetical protein PG984_014875 [Apiospora sp. TS-2023a]
MSAVLAGIDVCYFRLHACIDNADTGHAAMALDIVIRYLKSVRKAAEGKGEDGGSAVKKAWRCVQAGHVLSQELGRAHGEEGCHADDGSDDGDDCCLTENEANVIQILRLKSRAGHRLHRTSRVRIGRKLLVNWLCPICGRPSGARSICWMLWQRPRPRSGGVKATGAS